MTVIKPNKGIDSSQERNSYSYINDRIGFWGTVQEVNTSDHTVDVLMDVGRLALHVPVASDIWVVEKEEGSNNKSSGRRNLPPKGSFVFCLTPTRTLQGAFVLCSGIPYGNSFSKEYFSLEGEEEEFENSEERREVSGWTVKKNYDTGNIEIKSPVNDEMSNDVELSINLDTSNGQSLTLKAFGSEFAINNDSENGIALNIGSEENSIPLKISVHGNLSISAESPDSTVELSAMGDVDVSTTTGNVSITSEAGEISISGAAGISIAGAAGSLSIT